MTYFQEEDIWHLVISDEPESDRVELNSNITAELNENGELIALGQNRDTYRPYRAKLVF